MAQFSVRAAARARYCDSRQGVEQLAEKENIQIPDSLDSKPQSKIDKLAKLSGPEFDRAFVKDQMKDHKTWTIFRLRRSAAES